MFHEKQLSMETLPVKLYAVVTIGSTGAPTLTKGRGISTITRTSAGLYVLTIRGSGFPTLLGVASTFLVASGSPAAPVLALVSSTVGTANPNVITFQTSAPSGSSGALVATDPASGEVLYMELTFNNSTAI